MAKSNNKSWKIYLRVGVWLYYRISSLLASSWVEFFSSNSEMFAVILIALLWMFVYAFRYMLSIWSKPNHIDDLNLNQIYEEKLSHVKQNKVYIEKTKEKMSMPFDLLGKMNTSVSWYAGSQSDISKPKKIVTRKPKVKKLTNNNQSTHTSLSGDVTYTTNTSRRISWASNKVYSPFSLDGK